MNRLERMKEILKASPDFGKRVGYKMCVVDVFHDMKDLEKENKKLKKACHKWFMRWREAKKDALYFDSSLQKQIEATYKVVEKLNEAKEILKEFVGWANWQGNSKCPSFKIIKDKAEKFIKKEE